MSNIFLLLGGNRLNYGILKKFKDKGYLVFVIDWNEHPQMTGDKHYRLDVKDADAIIHSLQQDGYWEQVAFAYSSIDLAVPSVAKINKAIGLRTISDDGLRYSSSKSMMASKWQESGLLNRISKKYMQMQSEIIDFNKSYKMIIKPDNSASSRGITILEKNSPDELVWEAFEKAQNEASNNIVVVEEFVEGTEFTVEMIGDDYGNVCVYGMSRKTHTKNTVNNKIAVKLHYNAVPDDLQRKIADVAIKCYKALGFSASLGHLEIILKEDGTLSPVEIGARSSGFIASDLVDIVSGSDFLADLIKVQNGMPVMNGLHPQTEKSSLYFFYDFPAGSIIKKPFNFTDFLESSIISRYSNRSNLVEGRCFDNIDNDNARVGFEILEGRKSMMTIDYIKRQEQQMLREILEK
ncbi:MAG: ATP-grasp domain-containing protein [Alphaproteobacteria bacterium]|nr:ATP-grasp domain-containing protein [Alphaproteobacteria bacterium]